MELTRLHTRNVWEIVCDVKLYLVGENVVKMNRAYSVLDYPPPNWKFLRIMHQAQHRINPNPPPQKKT